VVFKEAARLHEFFMSRLGHMMNHSGGIQLVTPDESLEDALVKIKGTGREGSKIILAELFYSFRFITIIFIVL
jgi:hypothetical protein